MLDYNKSILSNNFNPSKFDFNPWDLDVHLEKGERDPEKTENMIEKNPGGPTISFRLYTNQSFQQRGQIGMCSPDSNRGRAQLTARRQQAAGFHWCRRPVPKMAFHALSLAILGKAMSSMALPLTSPALLPSVAGWDCSNPLNLTVRMPASAAPPLQRQPVKPMVQSVYPGPKTIFYGQTPGTLRSK